MNELDVLFARRGINQAEVNETADAATNVPQVTFIRAVHYLGHRFVATADDDGDPWRCVWCQQTAPQVGRMDWVKVLSCPTVQQ